MGGDAREGGREGEGGNGENLRECADDKRCMSCFERERERER